MFEGSQFTAGNNEENVCQCVHKYLVFLCGLLLGIFLTLSLRWFMILSKANDIYRNEEENRMSDRERKRLTAGHSKSSLNMNETPMLDNDDGSFQVLEAALSLVSKQIHDKRSEKMVVKYLSPEEMLSTLFADDDYSSLNLKHSISSNKVSGTQEMVQCFQQILKYSVNTNHPFFFNQLFGALDPIALAAEFIALSVNTSAYTYETAPVFTLIEREVFFHLSQLVFGANVGYDGLMIPGGSMSNLTALHIARYYARNCGLQSMKVNDLQAHGAHEEKKQEDCSKYPSLPDTELVAFVSSEAHYSFAKAVSVTGIGNKNLVVVPTLQNGQMDVRQLDILMTQLENDCEAGRGKKIPFFVAVTSGSTVRGSFDDITAIIEVCRLHEDRLNAQHTPNFQRISDRTGSNIQKHKIWIHVDGAWGGSAVFATRQDVRELVKGVEQVDSFTFNPHKMLGAPQQTTAFLTRHEGILKAANSRGAKYLFDSRKHGANYDLGDTSYTCGRRTDAIKLWAQLKFYGPHGIGLMIESKVDSLQSLAGYICNDDRFMLACGPWPFNVNFYYLPMRIRKKLVTAGVNVKSDVPNIPDEISQDLTQISVKLKLALHKSGEMLIPFQPLNDQKADCFRVVLAGKKCLENSDIEKMLNLMDEFGRDL